MLFVTDWGGEKVLVYSNVLMMLYIVLRSGTAHVFLCSNQLSNEDND